MPLPFIAPPLINTANPWATSEADLRALFACEHTGAVTTRTSLLAGFPHDDTIHQYGFFDAGSNAPTTGTLDIAAGSLNTLGYSPYPLSEYLRIIADIAQTTKPVSGITWKPCIVSVTGSSDDVMRCYQMICEAQRTLKIPLCMEVNLSCPNIPDKPPPAYSKSMLKEYLEALRLARKGDGYALPIGLKTPPYTYHDQFVTLIDALVDMGDACPIEFISAVNTLGSSLVLVDGPAATPVLNSASGAGIGGMAGAPLHPLALGNVKTLRSMLDQHRKLESIDIIGMGGVSDHAGYKRMQAVGATVVGIGTALGHSGIAIFEKVVTGDQSSG